MSESSSPFSRFVLLPMQTLFSMYTSVASESLPLPLLVCVRSSLPLFFLLFCFCVSFLRAWCSSFRSCSNRNSARCSFMRCTMSCFVTLAAAMLSCAIAHSTVSARMCCIFLRAVLRQSAMSLRFICFPVIMAVNICVRSFRGSLDSQMRACIVWEGHLCLGMCCSVVSHRLQKSLTRCICEKCSRSAQLTLISICAGVSV